jgi:hypothetical protein
MAISSERTRRRTFYKDWYSGQPIILSHDWPLSADDWFEAGHPTPAAIMVWGQLSK